MATKRASGFSRGRARTSAGRSRRASTAGRSSLRLTAAQRNKLPDSAFVYPSSRKYPVPTAAQARRAGIGETQRIRMHRNALSRAAQSGTSGSYSRVAQKVNIRGSVTPTRLRRR